MAHCYFVVVDSAANAVVVIADAVWDWGWVQYAKGTRINRYN